MWIAQTLDGNNHLISLAVTQNWKNEEPHENQNY